MADFIVTCCALAPVRIRFLVRDKGSAAAARRDVGSRVNDPSWWLGAAYAGEGKLLAVNILGVTQTDAMAETLATTEPKNPESGPKKTGKDGWTAKI